METQMNKLNIPVPPAPVLEQAVGYQKNRNVRYLALWWEPAGDEAMISDGFVTFTGHWPGYLAFVHHKAVYPRLASYNLGSSDCPAEYHLLVDLLDRRVYVAKCSEAERVLADQWAKAMAQYEPVAIPAEYMDILLLGSFEQVEPTLSMVELMRRMDEEQQAVEKLTCWLDQHANKHLKYPRGTHGYLRR